MDSKQHSTQLSGVLDPSADFDMFGGTPMEMAPEPDYMQSFIRQHMTLILRPTAEHVREAHTKLQSVSSEMAHSNARTDNLQCSMTNMQDQHANLQSNLTATNAKLDKANLELADAQAAQASLMSELKCVRSMLGTSDNKVDTSTTLLDSMMERILQLNDQVQKLQASSTKTTKVVEEHTGTLSELHDFYKGVNFRLVNTSKDVEQLQQHVVALDRTWKKHASNTSQQREEDSKQAGVLTDRTNSLFDVLGDTNRNLQVLSDKTSTHEAALARLVGTVGVGGDTVAKVSNLLRRVGEVDALVEEHTGRLEQMDSTTEVFRKDFQAESFNVSSLLHDLNSKVTANTSELLSLEQVQSAHGDNLNKSERSICDLTKEQHALKSQTEGLKREVLDASTFKADTLHRLESHTRSLLRKADLEATQKDFGDMAVVVQGVKDQLSTTNTNVSKLLLRFDNCNKNLHGLSKGFEDVHRHVVLGENGMLPPRCSEFDGHAGAGHFSARGGGGGGALPHLRPATAGPRRSVGPS